MVTLSITAVVFLLLYFGGDFTGESFSYRGGSTGFLLIQFPLHWRIEKLWGRLPVALSASSTVVAGLLFSTVAGDGELARITCEALAAGALAATLLFRFSEAGRAGVKVAPGWLVAVYGLTLLFVGHWPIELFTRVCK